MTLTTFTHIVGNVNLVIAYSKDLKVTSKVNHGYQHVATRFIILTPYIVDPIIIIVYILPVRKFITYLRSYFVKEKESETNILETVH